MPQRRQHRRGDGSTRKDRAAAAAARVVSWEPSEDDIWAEHQEWERHRRAAPPVVHTTRRKPFDIRPVLKRVLGDFSRWDGEAAAREDLGL